MNKWWKIKIWLGYFDLFIKQIFKKLHLIVLYFLREKWYPFDFIFYVLHSKFSVSFSQVIGEGFERRNVNGDIAMKELCVYTW